jgi:hypothetical protein
MRAAFSKAEIESEIASRFGTAFKRREKSAGEGMSTGIPEVDSLTGGLPRGAITEIFGPASSGRTTFMLSTLAYATNHEEVCALVDASDVLDPASATGASVVLHQLLWIRCASNVEHAFKATDLLLQGGGFGLVVLDIGDVPPRDARRIISSWWYRFRRIVETTPTAFVVIAQDSCVRSCASLTLEMKRNADVWSAVSNPLSLPDSSYETTHSSRDASSINLLSPVTRLSPAIYQPSKSHLQTTHSNLLIGMQLRVERQKPVHPGTRQIQFAARAFH